MSTTERRGFAVERPMPGITAMAIIITTFKFQPPQAIWRLHGLEVEDGTSAPGKQGRTDDGLQYGGREIAQAKLQEAYRAL